MIETTMSETKKTYNAADLLEDLKSNELLDGDKEKELQSYIQTEQDKRGLPAYLHVIAAIGAILASALFINFMDNIGFIDHNDQNSLMLRGLSCAVIAILIQLFAEPRFVARHALVTMTSLTLMFMGKSLILASFFIPTTTNTALLFSMVAFILSGATYFLFPNPIDRFLTLLFAVGAAYASIFVDPYAQGLEEPLFSAFIAIQLGVIAICLYARAFTRQLEPLFYAMIISICVGVIFLSLHGDLIPSEGIRFNMFYPGLIIAMSLICLIGWISKTREEELSEPLRCAMIGAFLLGVVAAPGVTLAVGLMVLAYQRAETFLMSLGVILLTFFIIHYYYNMHITLLEKSGVLVLSGLLLLVAGWFMKAQGWTRGASS